MKNPETDYSEVYRKDELKKLNGRIKNIRNILYVCAAAIATGALLFWVIKIPAFTVRNLMLYFLLSAVFAGLGFFCDKRPHTTVVSALLICIVFWSAELMLNNAGFFIEGSIQKIFVVALLSSCLNYSREAEIIQKELSLS
jgi:pheromone shutdown protein TraB